MEREQQKISKLFKDWQSKTPEERFRNKHGCKPPKLTKKELAEYESKRSFGSERQEQWYNDVIQYNKRKKK